MSTRAFGIVVVALLVAFTGCQCDDGLGALPGNLRGKVCHPDTGDGLAGASVTIVNIKTGSTRESVADQNGEYSFLRVATGLYTVIAVLGDVQREFQVEVQAKVDDFFTDTACREGPGTGNTGVLDGQICNRHTGRLITNGEVVLEASNGDIFVTRTDATDGTFELVAIPEGEHIVTIRGEGFQRAFLVEIAAGERTTLNLADGCEAPSASEGGIVGSFCNPSTNGNLIGAEVAVTPADGDGESARDITDTAGEFLVNGLPPGLYRVDITHPDFSFTEPQVEVEAGQFATVTDPSSCNRDEFGRIEGQICDDEAGGSFVGNVDLILGVSVVRSATSDSAGRFAFNAVAPGTYTVRAHRNGYERIFSGIVVEPFRTAFIQEFNCPEPEEICDEVVNNPSVTADGRIFLVVDRSGSMGENDANGQQKWATMKSALINVTRALDATVEFGLMTYPSNGECGAGNLQVALGAGTAGQIETRLNQISPGGGTPTAPTLAEARALITPFVNDGRPLAVLLATDGGPNCETGAIVSQTSATCRCTNIGQQGACQLHNCLDVESDGDGPVTEIGRIRDLGVKTFVVGVTGIENFADVLNNMAVAGGTDLPGATKYYEANDQAQLQQALDEITQRVFSCRVDVGRDVTSASRITVRVGDRILTRDAARRNGWDITTPTTVELFGSACDIASAAGAQPVVVQTCFSP